MLVRLAVLVTILAATAAGFARHGAAARSGPGATIDRTLACTVLPAGVGAIQAAAAPKLGSVDATPAQVTLSTGTGTQSSLLAIYAPGVRRWPAGVTIDAALCRTAKANVPLSFRSLRGGVQPLGAHATCLAARQVLVHLHVVMAAKPNWTSSGTTQVAHGKPLSADVAVQSHKRKPLAFMSFTGSKASFFSAKNCF